MAENKKPTVEELQKENEALKAENQALRDAEEEAPKEERVPVPKERKFKVGKHEYVFAEVAECWWNSKKVKVADVLKDEDLLEEMVKANFILISKVTK